MFFEVSLSSAEQNKTELSYNLCYTYITVLIITLNIIRVSITDNVSQNFDTYISTCLEDYYNEVLQLSLLIM